MFPDRYEEMQQKIRKTALPAVRSPSQPMQAQPEIQVQKRAPWSFMTNYQPLPMPQQYQFKTPIPEPQQWATERLAPLQQGDFHMMGGLMPLLNAAVQARAARYGLGVQEGRERMGAQQQFQAQMEQMKHMANMQEQAMRLEGAMEMARRGETGQNIRQMMQTGPQYAKLAQYDPYTYVPNMQGGATPYYRGQPARQGLLTEPGRQAGGDQIGNAVQALMEAKTPEERKKYYQALPTEVRQRVLSMFMQQEQMQRPYAMPEDLYGNMWIQ